MRDSGELTAAAIAVCVTKGSGDKGVGSLFYRVTKGSGVFSTAHRSVKGSGVFFTVHRPLSGVGREVEG